MQRQELGLMLPRQVGGFASQETQLTGLYRALTDERIGWAVRKSDTELLELLDAALSRWRDNGQLELIEDRWIRVRKRAIERRGRGSQ